MPERPWISGPRELLVHAFEHFKSGTSFGHRIALISVDNAVELAIQTYLGLPERSRGAPGPPKKELDDARGRLPALLNLLEKYAAELIPGINLGDVEYYHRLRNMLYHEGNGIAVEPDKVEAYLEIARLLFQSLFAVDVRGDILPAPKGERAQVVEKWAELETLLRLVSTDQPRIAEQETHHDATPGSPDPIPSSAGTDHSMLRLLRDEVVHGDAGANVIHEAVRRVERAEREAAAAAGTDLTSTNTCPPRQRLPTGCVPYLANRESSSLKHANPRLHTRKIEVADQELFPIEYDELDRRFANSGYRRGYVLAFVPGGSEDEVRDRGVRVNRGRGTPTWGVRYMYNALGCWGYPITLIHGVFRLWTVDSNGRLMNELLSNV
jgi:hypothetical protein